MDILFLAVVFAVIIILLMMKRPLWQAITGGVIFMILLFRIPLFEALQACVKVFTVWSSLSVLAAFYVITFLQRMLEKREQIRLASRDLNGLFHNRRVNAGGASCFIGLLPSAAAMILCGDLVKEATDGYLEPKEQAFVTTWFRHIPESALPTYASVLLMSNLSGVELPGFVAAMIVPVIALASIGYVLYLRKVPSDPGTPVSENRLLDLCSLFKHLWTLILILTLILGFHFSIISSVIVTIVIMIFVYRFRLDELKPIVVSAFEKKLMLNTVLVLILKELISYTGVLEKLPEVLSALPIPMYLIFALLFFLGALISGSTGIIAMGTPLAFSALPEGGVPLMVLLMCMCHAASQISPVHVCLTVASDYYKISLGELIRKSLLPVAIYIVVVLVYYNLLTLI